MIAVKFACGHNATLTGSESVPRCMCGETRVMCVTAPPPKFRGLVQGPHATYEVLKAIPVELKQEASHG